MEIKINYEELANMLIDDYIDLHGLKETIIMLHDSGYSNEEIIYGLNFNNEDVCQCLDGYKK